MPSPESAPTLALLDAVCSYYGGPFNPDTHDYRTPQVDGLGFIRRQIVKPTEREFQLLSMPGVSPGSLLVVFVSGYRQNRQALGGVAGGVLRRVSRVHFHLYTRSTQLDPVAAQDEVYELTERVTDHLMADPQCGTGGLEAGGVLLVEGDDSGLAVSFGTPSPVKLYTQQVVTFAATATQYLRG